MKKKLSDKFVLYFMMYGVSICLFATFAAAAIRAWQKNWFEFGIFLMTFLFISVISCFCCTLFIIERLIQWKMISPSPSEVTEEA